MTFGTTEEAVKSILRIIEDEGQRLSALASVEEPQRKNRVNEMMVSLRCGSRTFRIRLAWVRDERVPRSGFRIGFAYIESDWEMVLRPQAQEIPVAPPLQWELYPRDYTTPFSPHPDILEESWLRQLIRNKLAFRTDA
jgi:hypothetical protein